MCPWLSLQTFQYSLSSGALVSRRGRSTQGALIISSFLSCFQFKLMVRSGTYCLDVFMDSAKGWEVILLSI